MIYQGEILRAWAKEIKIVDPLVAETSIVCWAFELAKYACYQNILMESNTKNCFDDWNGVVKVQCSSIDSFCCKAKTRSLSSNSYYFCWVRKKQIMWYILWPSLLIFKILLFSVVIRPFSLPLYCT